MNSGSVLQAVDIKKKFKVYANPWDILKEWLSFGSRSYHKDYWAIKGISFEVKRGEFLGIIGPNGAGKSTLLRIITDVLPPTEGHYETKGRVLSILELSGGTDGDLTGRENVVRSGQLFGFPDDYVSKRLEQIKEFSELGDFFEQPLRTYSTGMKSRLAFSMFVFMETDVLILDEVLAVGDIFFKQKCFERLAELIRENTSIILVTHTLGIVQRYCDRVILLNDGEKLYDGDPGEAIRLFMQLRGEKRADVIRKMTASEEKSMITAIESPAPVSSQTWKPYPQDWPPESISQFRIFSNPRGWNKVDFLRLVVLNDYGEPSEIFKQGEQMHIYCEFRLKSDIPTSLVAVEIRDQFNLLIHSKNAVQNGAGLTGNVSNGDVIRYYQSITLNIAPSTYVVNLQALVPNGRSVRPEKRWYTDYLNDVSYLWKLDRAFAIVVQSRFGEDIEVAHGGLCDLPGKSHIKIIRHPKT